MSQKLEPCLSILPDAQQVLWPDLCSALDLGFVLYGGTAIALRLGHRISVDFDFFSEAPLDYDALHSTFPFLSDSLVVQQQPNTFTVLVPKSNQTVKLSFFGPVRFGRTGTPQVTVDGVMQIASLDDLMATKLKVILQRVEAKDYIDIAAMFRAGVSLEKGLAAAQMMFEPTFQPSECLKALVYFEGGDLEMVSSADRTTLIMAVRQIRDLPDVQILSRQLTA